MERNITWLNSKWWYRLLKVIYVFILVGCCLLAIAVAVDELAPVKVVNYDESAFECASGKQIVLNELSYSLSRYAVRGNISSRSIASLCDYPDAFGEKIDGSSPLPLREELERKYSDEGKRLVSEWEVSMQNSYKVNTVMKTEGGWLYVLLASLASITGILLFLEIIKRIFYYVLLGTLRPKK